LKGPPREELQDLRRPVKSLEGPPRGELQDLSQAVSPGVFGGPSPGGATGPKPTRAPWSPINKYADLFGARGQCDRNPGRSQMALAAPREQRCRSSTEIRAGHLQRYGPVIYRDTGRSSTEIPAVSSSEIRAGHLQRYGGVSSPEIRWFFISRDTVGNLSDSSAFSEDASQIGVLDESKIAF